MADLVTRILLEDKQFNDKIQQSKKNLAGFDAQAQKAGGGVGGLQNKIGGLVSGGLMKLVGGFGAAATAGAAFKKMIDTTQTNTDSFNSVVAQAKGSVDYFFASIAMGDFSNFFSGLDGAIARARILYEEMDKLVDMQAGWSDIESEKRTKINENTAGIYDADTPLERKKELIAENKKLIGELAQKGEKVADQLAKVAVETAKTKAQMSDITEVDVKRYLQQISMHDDKAFYEYAEKRDALEKKISETAADVQRKKFKSEKKDLSTKVKDLKIGVSPSDGAIIAAAKLKALKANNAELEKFYKINELISDTNRKDIVDLRNQGRAIESNISSLKRQSSMVERRVLKREKSGGGGGGKIAGKASAEVMIPQGSIAEIEKKLSDAKKAFANAVTDDARAAADRLIKELESKKVVLEVSFKGAGGSIENEAKPLKNNGRITDFSGVNMKNHMYKPDIKVFESHSDKIARIASQNRDLIESFYGLGDAVGNFGSVLDEESAAWLRWGGTVLSTVGQAIPALTALAGAKAANSVANIPIVGPIMAVGAIASIIGAFASLPKFEHSGIVGGNSYTGDKLLARVNSGELILNTKHQTSLLNQLESSDGRAGNVVFKISGKELVGILNQESTRMSRR